MKTKSKHICEYNLFSIFNTVLIVLSCVGGTALIKPKL